MTDNAITQQQLDELNWFHEFDFANGLKARSRNEAANRPFFQVHRSFIKNCLEKIDFNGKTVIEVGCWDGYFSFLAEELGAKSVIATDDYSQNYGSSKAFKIAKQLKKSKVNLQANTSVYDLSHKIQGKFDIILFLGVYYHLHSPYSAVAQLRSLCHPNSLVVVEGDCLQDEENASAKLTLDDPHVSKFIPTTKLLKDMLHSCYFKVEAMAFLSNFDVSDAIASVKRDALFEKLRTSVDRKKQYSQQTTEKLHKENHDRVLIVAKPFWGENQYHCYRPPFGLDRYDTRTKY